MTTFSLSLTHVRAHSSRYTAFGLLFGYLPRGVWTFEEQLLLQRLLRMHTCALTK